MDVLAGKYMLWSHVSILADIRTVVSSHLVNIIANVCDCDGVCKYTQSIYVASSEIATMVNQLSKKKWCVRCQMSIPLTRSNEYRYSFAFYYDNGWWRHIDGCICKYLPPEDLRGYETSYEMYCANRDTDDCRCFDCDSRLA